MPLGQVLLGLALYLSVTAGVLLLVTTLYASTLAYVLRSFSRSQLLEKLPRSGEERLEWLEKHEEDLQVISGFVRLAANLLILLWVASWFVDLAAPHVEPFRLVAALVVTVGLLLIFAIGVPHALALHSGEAVLARSIPLLMVARTVFWPIARCLAAIEFIVRRLLGKPEDSQEEESERVEQEILDAVSEGEAQGTLDEDQMVMIRSILDLHDTPVSAIMTPRTDIEAIQADVPLDQVRAMIVEGGHSRIPVYEESVDHIIGLLYAKDLIGVDGQRAASARDLMRPARYVPETKTIDQLLREFRQNKVHIAIVLDEYGGTAGLITIEDILEELVGEIDDEYDETAPPPINQIDADTLEVDARVHVEEVNEQLHVELPEDGDYETIGGLVFTMLGKIPATGEEVRHENVQIQVIDAEERKINRLRVHVEREVEED